jgi:cytoskeletal protein RodZ
MNNFSPMVKISGIVLVIGVVIFVMLSIVLITFVVVRITSPSPSQAPNPPTQADILTPTTYLEATASPVSATAFPPTHTSVPPTLEPISSATPLPADGPAIQTAADFLAEYFTLINSRDYPATWAKLSDKYKTAHNPDGYGPYVNFWDTVDRVDVLTPDVVYQNTDRAKVSARLNFAYKNGKTGSQLVTFELIPDDQGTSWLIDDSY